MKAVIVPQGLRVGQSILSPSIVDRIAQLAEQLLSMSAIAKRVRRPKSEVSAVLSLRRQAEKVMNADLVGKAPLSRMGRAENLSMLPEHRGPDGTIDWESVRGYRSDRGLASWAASAAIRETTTKSGAATKKPLAGGASVQV